MRIERRSGGDERRILIGMIVDPIVTGRVANKWDREEGLFANKWANLIGGWCVSYYEKFGGAPGGAIASRYEAWATTKQRDKDTVDLVERFLTSLNDEYEALGKESNTEYTTDLAARHFNHIRLRRLRDALEGDLDEGNLEEAEKRLANWGRVEMGAGSFVDVFADENVIREAFEEQHEPLIQYEGALGQFYGYALERDAFIAYMAPEKRGKTFVLMDNAWEGIAARRRVAFFSVGDLSRNQVVKRFMARAAAHPLRATKPGRVVLYPTDIYRGEEDTYATVTHDERRWEEDLGWRAAHAAAQRFMQVNVKGKDYLRLGVYPAGTINVAGIREVIRGWEREGWVPDIIIIDYADILAPPAGTVDTRDQINATWRQLRAMSQALHGLVITATQSDAASYTADTIGRSNFSEDKRKLAHVTGMIGINQAKQEKDLGVMRLNWVALREGEYSEYRCVHVAGCLAIASPFMWSTW